MPNDEDEAVQRLYEIQRVGVGVIGACLKSTEEDHDTDLPTSRNMVDNVRMLTEGLSPHENFLLLVSVGRMAAFMLRFIAAEDDANPEDVLQKIALAYADDD